eukprot:GHVP01047308.1.p1 GENE.GHVP01047308.1~~GHVP01047308.1.p1  ORF type:complete len:109 (-),score=1.86 GHVP01047308.1:556-882(-)
MPEFCIYWTQHNGRGLRPYEENKTLETYDGFDRRAGCEVIFRKCKLLQKVYQEFLNYSATFNYIVKKECTIYIDPDLKKSVLRGKEVIGKIFSLGEKKFIFSGSHIRF